MQTSYGWVGLNETNLNIAPSPILDSGHAVLYWTSMDYAAIVRTAAWLNVRVVTVHKVDIGYYQTVWTTLIVLTTLHYAYMYTLNTLIARVTRTYDRLKIKNLKMIGKPEKSKMTTLKCRISKEKTEKPENLYGWIVCRLYGTKLNEMIVSL